VGTQEQEWVPAHRIEEAIMLTLTHLAQTPARGMDPTSWPLFVCVLGGFRVLRAGQPCAGLSGGKAETLLGLLALRYDVRVPRDTLLAGLWPDTDPVLARQSLNSLVYSLHKQLGGALGGAPPIEYADGYSWLNVAAGVGVDLACYEALVGQGDRHRSANDRPAALTAYQRAVQLYRGDLWSGPDLHAVMERERLRASYLTLLARLADQYYAGQQYDACLDCCGRLLASDPCREDAHRLVMRCHVHQGERAQALRQYRVCADVLSAEFAAAPEPATAALYEQIRCDPAGVP
jgi:DNA-binding SARP family transcriptional activator